MFPLPQLNFRQTPVVLFVAAIAAALETACLLRDATGGVGSLRDILYTQDRLGLLSPVWSGEWWRPVTTALLHGDPLHAAFNIYWLLVFGGALERHLGRYRFTLLLVLLAEVSMMSQFVVSNYRTSDLSQQQGVVGLSGVMYGLFGMLLIGRRRKEELHAACDDTTAWLMAGWFVFCVVGTQAGLFIVANVAHGVGLVFGLLYGGVAFDRQRRRWWLCAALPATLVALTTLVYVPGCELYEQHRQREQLRRLFRMEAAITASLIETPG